VRHERVARCRRLLLSRRNALLRALSFAIIIIENGGTKLMFVGVFLLALGVLFLLRNGGVIHGDAWDLIWPLLIVAFGVSILFKKRED
jgi:hypothetical protein